MFPALALLLGLGPATRTAQADEDDPLLQAVDLSRPVEQDPYRAPRTIADVYRTFNAKRETAAIDSLHLVIVADENAVGVGEAARRDRIAIKDLFDRSFANQPNRRQIIEFSDRELTPQSVVRKIASLQLGPKDALVVYFSGHGELETTDEVVSQEMTVRGPRNIFRSHHVLRLGDQRLARANVRTAMGRTGARFNVLFTDCCRPRAPGDSTTKVPLHPNFRARTALDTSKVNEPLFRDLFVFHSGFIDISTGDALSNPAYGGVLTQCFIAACCYHQPTFTFQPRIATPGRPNRRIIPNRVDRNRDSFVEWREFEQLWSHLISDYSGAEQNALIEIY
jgi:hypothetical protein